jgi:hypothetical protein
MQFTDHLGRPTTRRAVAFHRQNRLVDGVLRLHIGFQPFLWAFCLVVFNTVMQNQNFVLSLNLKI